MAYYVLRSEAQELYAMNLILSEDEARQYGSEGHMAIVKAIYIWTRSEGLESFQQFLSATQHDADSPYGGLIRDMRAERVDVLEFKRGTTARSTKPTRKAHRVCGHRPRAQNKESERSTSSWRS